MTFASKFQSVAALFAAVAQVHPMRGDEVNDLPVVSRGGSHGLLAIVLVYRQPAIARRELVYPPHYRAILDAETGSIVESGYVAPEDFGVKAARYTPTDGFGLDDVSPSEFRDGLKRIAEISPAVWMQFANAGVPLVHEEQMLAHEYRRLFDRVIYKPLMPYYRAAACEFFEWLAAV